MVENLLSSPFKFFFIIFVTASLPTQPDSLIGLGKSGYQVNFFYLKLYKNICCGYSLEVPH